jgi:hypothetical protein
MKWAYESLPDCLQVDHSVLQEGCCLTCYPLNHNITTEFEGTAFRSVRNSVVIGPVQGKPANYKPYNLNMERKRDYKSFEKDVIPKWKQKSYEVIPL